MIQLALVLGLASHIKFSFEYSRLSLIHDPELDAGSPAPQRESPTLIVEPTNTNNTTLKSGKWEQLQDFIQFGTCNVTHFQLCLLGTSRNVCKIFELADTTSPIAPSRYGCYEALHLWVTVGLCGYKSQSSLKCCLYMPMPQSIYNNFSVLYAYHIHLTRRPLTFTNIILHKHT